MSFGPSAKRSMKVMTLFTIIKKKPILLPKAMESFLNPKTFQ